MDQAEEAYFAPGADKGDPDASPCCAPTSPPGSRPAHVVTAGFDPLRDEGEAYAELLEKARRRGDHASATPS